MKKLIEKLLSGEGRISLLLLEAKQFAEQAKDETFLDFINKELNGYTGQELPEYRKIKGQIVADIADAFGHLIRQNQPLDYSGLSEKNGN